MGGFLVEYKQIKILNEDNVRKALIAGCKTGACAVQLLSGSKVPSRDMLQELSN